MSDAATSVGSSASSGGVIGARACASRDGRIAAGIALALAIFWIATLPSTPAWGWDESMHAELPAARMLVALRHFEIGRAFGALLDCAQYPFAWPVCLALAQSLSGISEHVARAACIVAWCATLVGVFLLACELALALPEDRRARRWVPWIAFALAALCPLALSYAGTLFLEVPFACAAVFALRAWVRLAREPSRRRAFAAGTWIALALFTKFNYGLLLVLGLALDALVQLAGAARRGETRPFLARMARTALVPAVACAWWFVLPLPGGLAIAAEHRTALLDFLHGNLGGAPTPAGRRVLYAAACFAPTPRFLVLEIVAFLAALRFVRDPAVRVLALVFVAATLPVELHPFHQDRFLIPGGPALWALAALGIASLVPRATGGRIVVLAILAVTTLLAPGTDTHGLADALGLLPSDARNRAYVEQVLDSSRAMGAGRRLPTQGLERGEHDAILDLVAKEARPDERIGWIGVSQALSPAAIAIGSLQRGGSPERFLRDATKPIDVAYFGVDPQWDDGRFAEFAAGFDVIFATEPPDARDQVDRRWPRGYRERLTAKGSWIARPIGAVDIARPLGDPRRVTLFACRPAK